MNILSDRSKYMAYISQSNYVCVVLSDLQSVDSAVQTLSVCWRSSQAFNLLPQPVLSCFMLLHQLGALPLCQDALLQVSFCILKIKVLILSHPK